MTSPKPSTLPALLILLLFSPVALGDESQARERSDGEETIRASVVQLRLDNGRSLGTGVCISEKGYIVFRNTGDPRVPRAVPGGALLVTFEQGLQGNAAVLGWSNEWGIAVAKLDGNGPFAHVDFDKLQNESVGQECVIAEYVAGSSKLTLTPAKVSEIEEQWLSVNGEMDGFAPVLTTNGELMGITTIRPVGFDTVQTSVAVIAELFEELRKPQNVDRNRSASVEIESTVGTTDSPESLVKSVSVRIRPEDNEASDRGWSGTIIENGYVVTCGHYRRPAGTKVTIYFSDGTSVPGTIIGTNPVIDIGLVKIVGDGNWSTATIGSSLKLDSNCVVSGYPEDALSLEPTTVEATYKEPDGHLWSAIFYSLPSDDNGPQSGMSGSGVFDEAGRLIGIHLGRTGKYLRHVRIEFARLQWEALGGLKGEGASLDDSSH